jgi:hypothetical protein
MTNRLEKANVQGLKYLVELAQIRKVAVQGLMGELGITQKGHESRH